MTSKMTTLKQGLLVAAVAVIATMLLASHPAPTWAQYTVTDLGRLGSSESEAFGLNNSGQVVGGSRTTSGAYHAFLYSDGTITDLGGMESSASGINDSGQVVGRFNTYHAFLYSGGVMTDLGTLGGMESCAYAINNSGQVVGRAASSDDVGHAFLYSGGVMTNLGAALMPGTSSQANGLNSSGQVVGYYAPGGMSHAFLYSGGHMTNLSTLSGSGVSCAYGINDSGQVVGNSSSTVPYHYSHAFLYSNGRMTDLGTLGGLESCAYGINNSGQVVGAANIPDGGPTHAFLYSGGAMTDLNSLIDPASGWHLWEATAINNNGQIVGWGAHSTGDFAAFLLTPVPEPATLGLLAAGLAGLLARRRCAGK